MPANRSLVARMLIQTVVWLGITGALLFVSAGTVRWPQAWIYLAEIGGLGLLSGFAIGKRDPALLRERMAAPIQQGQKSWDRIVILVLFALWMSQYVIIGLDAVRLQWSQVPLWLQVAGGLAVAFGLYAFHVVLETNTFAAPVVKIQSERKHQVVSTTVRPRAPPDVCRRGAAYRWDAAVARLVVRAHLGSRHDRALGLPRGARGEHAQSRARRV
jgi:hypothetical protein